MVKLKSQLRSVSLVAAFLSMGVPSLSYAETVLEYWTWNNEGDYVKVDDSAIARFEAANPGVTIDISYVPYADYMTKLKAALAANEPPDIFQVPWNSGFRDLAASGKLEPMDTILSEGFPDINQSAKDFVTLEGQAWALPLDLNTLQIAYNKTTFDELGLSVPQTNDELIAVAKALDDAGYFGIALGTKDKWAGGDIWFAQLVYSDPTGTKLSQADAGTISWNDPVFVAAGDRVAELIKNGVFAPGANSMGAFNESLDLFVSGAAAMFYPVGNFISGGIAEKVGGEFEWDLFPFPGGPDDTPTATGGIARMFSLPADGENNGLAADFLRTLTDGEGEAVLTRYNFIPSWPIDVPSDASALYSNFTNAQASARSRTIYTPAAYAALLDGIQAAFGSGMQGEAMAASLQAAVE